MHQAREMLNMSNLEALKFNICREMLNLLNIKHVKHAGEPQQ